MCCRRSSSASAAAVTVDLARRLSGSLVLGVAAGLGIALTPIVWAVGTHADPHALHFAFLAIILWLLVRWEQAGAARRGGSGPSTRRRPAGRDRADRLLLAAAVVVGLSVGNHSLTLLLGPPIILFVLAVEPEHPPPARGSSPRASPRSRSRPSSSGSSCPPRPAGSGPPFVYADPSTGAASGT